jgi:hypothetical protein
MSLDDRSESRGHWRPRTLADRLPAQLLPGETRETLVDGRVRITERRRAGSRAVCTTLRDTCEIISGLFHEAYITRHFDACFTAHSPSTPPAVMRQPSTAEVRGRHAAHRIPDPPRVHTIPVAAKPCKKPSRVQGTSGALRQSAEDLQRWAAIMAALSAIDAGTPAPAIRLPLDPAPAHPRERPFSQESGARLDLQARSSTMRRWTVAEEAGMP